MVVNDSNIIVQSSGLKSVEILEGAKICIELKNRTTLTFEPVVEEDKVVGYEMVYLTGKENKQIEKMQEKILSLQKQISTVQSSMTNGDESETEEETEEDEKNEEVTE